VGRFVFAGKLAGRTFRANGRLRFTDAASNLHPGVRRTACVKKKMTTSASQPDRAWEEHEHVAAPSDVEAQKLVNATGSVELAKQALDKAREPTSPAASKEELAKQLGYVSYLELFEASTAISDAGGRPWFVTTDRAGSCLLWNEEDLTPSRHPTREAAMTAIGHTPRDQQSPQKGPGTERSP
jgi:hypothetical protein